MEGVGDERLHAFLGLEVEEALAGLRIQDVDGVVRREVEAPLTGGDPQDGEVGLRVEVEVALDPLGPEGEGRDVEDDDRRGGRGDGDVHAIELLIDHHAIHPVRVPEARVAERLELRVLEGELPDLDQLIPLGGDEEAGLGGIRSLPEGHRVDVPALADQVEGRLHVGGSEGLEGRGGEGGADQGQGGQQGGTGSHRHPMVYRVPELCRLPARNPRWPR